MAQRGRAQAQELNLRPTLQPAPIPQVVTVQPVNRSGAGASIGRIADALSSLNGALTQYGYSTRQQQDRSQLEQAGTYSHMTPDMLRKELETNPDLMKNEKWRMMYAGKVATDFGTRLPAMLADPEEYDGSVDVPTFIAQKQAEVLQQFGNDDLSKAYFNKTMQPYADQLFAQEQAREASSIATQQQDIILAHIQTQRVNSEHVGASPVETAQAIFSGLKEVPGWNNFTREEKNKYLYNYAIGVAKEGNIDLFNALVDSAAPGGVALRDIASFRDNVITLREQATNQWRENNAKAREPILSTLDAMIGDPSKFTQEDVQRVINGAGELLTPEQRIGYGRQYAENVRKFQAEAAAINAHNAAKAQLKEGAVQAFGVGMGWNDDIFEDVEIPSATDPSKTVPYPAKELKQDAMAEIMNRIETRGKAQGLSRDMITTQIAATFSESGTTIPMWAQSLDATPLAASSAKMVDDIGEQAIANAELYDTIRGNNPVYIERHLEGKGTQDFWHLYGSFRDSGMTPKQALFSAGRSLSDREAMANANQQLNAAEGPYWQNGNNLVDRELEGDALAMGPVRDYARMLILSRVPAADALDRSLKWFKTTHKRIGGGWVNIAREGIPEGFDDEFNDYLNTFVEVNGQKYSPPLESSEDIIVAGDPSGKQFYLLDKNGMPLTAPSVKGKVIGEGAFAKLSLRGLTSYRKQRKAAEEIATDRNRQDIAAAIASPEERTFGGRGGTYKVPMTPQQIVDRNRARERGTIDQRSGVVEQALTKKNTRPEWVTTDAKSYFGATRSSHLKELTDDELRRLQSAWDSGKLPAQGGVGLNYRMIGAEIRRRSKLKDKMLKDKS